MDITAFNYIRDELYGELKKQGFSEPYDYEDEKGPAVMYRTDAVAYSICFYKDKKSFVLQSTNVNSKGEPGTWRQLSQWYYDEKTAIREDYESIANDFLDVVRGPQNIAFVQNTKKRKKNGEDENNIDPLFFFNRLANIYPEFKDTMNEERIVFGQIRFATVCRNVIAPMIEKCEDTETLNKTAELLSYMYKDGDVDTRSLVTAGVLNNIGDGNAIKVLTENFGDELKKVYKHSRKLIGKNIKPEKVKKAPKVVANALEAPKNK